jgi:hypothetical protein
LCASYFYFVYITEVIVLAWDSLLTYTESAVTASKTGSNIELNAAGMVELDFDVTAVSGTAPTLDIKIQESADGATFTDVVSLPQVTAVKKINEAIKSDKKYIRYVLTVTGTSPSFDFTLKIR